MHLIADKWPDIERAVWEGVRAVPLILVRLKLPLRTAVWTLGLGLLRQLCYNNSHHKVALPNSGHLVDNHYWHGPHI